MPKSNTHRIFHFLWVFIALLAPFCAYFMLAFSFMSERKESDEHPFRHFLLKTIPSPRIIIDSGSNAHHGIHSPTLEETFGISVINVADDAAIPLFMRVARLREHTHSGDILLLPLEYLHYTRDRVPAQIYIRIHRDLNYFHESLSFTEQLRFVASIPPATLLDHFFTEEPKVVGPKVRRSRWLSQFLDSSGDFEGYGSPDKWEYPAGWNFTSWNYGTEKLVEPSNDFAESLMELVRLRETGRIIFFTWPVVCGTPKELQIARGFTPFYERIRTMVEDAGFVFIGSPEDSMFDAKQYMYDTPAHVNERGRLIRTQTLIRQLKPHLKHLISANEAIPRNLTAKHLQKVYRSFVQEEIKQFSELKGTVVDFGPSPPQDVSTRCLLGEGWGLWEQGEAWSIRESSRLYLPVPLEGWDFAELHLSGYYYGENNSTRVFANEIFLGFFDFRKDEPLILTPDMVKSDGLLNLTIRHASTLSPASLGNSTDFRTLAFRLQSIALRFRKDPELVEVRRIVTEWYRRHLGRVPDPSGLAFWAKAVAKVDSAAGQLALEVDFRTQVEREKTEENATRIVP